jgi:hypothetical protein
MSRRAMLRAAGIGIALPLLDAMLPSGLRADEKIEALTPHRMVLVGRTLGLHAPNFFPEKAGRDYEATRYLKRLEPVRGDLTVFSGMSHVGYPGGHHTASALFTGVSPERIRGEQDVRNTVSLDDFAAERVGGETRVPSLVIGSYAAMSWNPKGVANPALTNQGSVFKKLFINGTPEEVARETRRLEDGKSILDVVRGQMKTLSGKLGASDRDRLDLFANSIREAEHRLQQDQAWATKPKPKVDYKIQEMPLEQMVGRQRQWYDIVRLALQTDSTRVIMLVHDEGGKAIIPGLTMAHHDASHHGKDAAKLEQLAIVEEAEMQVFSEFLVSLKTIQENGRSLLDKSIVLIASNLGNASAHSTSNLPIILAGGGFKHQGHVAYDQKKNMELSNVYVRMLKQMGIEADKFGISTGVLSDVG